MVTARSGIYSPISLHGRRVVLRTMTESDYDGWLEVRERCHDWLLKWEPRSAHATHLAEDQRSFVSRCAIRERERQMGTGYGFGIFLKGASSARSRCRRSSVDRCSRPISVTGLTKRWLVAVSCPKRSSRCCSTPSSPCACIESRSTSFQEMPLRVAWSRNSDCVLKASRSVISRLTERGRITRVTRSPPRSGTIVRPNSSSTGCYRTSTRPLRVFVLGIRVVRRYVDAPSVRPLR